MDGGAGLACGLAPEDAPRCTRSPTPPSAATPTTCTATRRPGRSASFHAHDLDRGDSRAWPRAEGFALVRRFEQDSRYVALLAVHPDHAGQGLGGALLNAVFAAARGDGYRQVVLNVASDNPNAVALYERVGMTQRWRVDDYQKPLPD